MGNSCKQCLLPAAVPDARLTPQGICSHCVDTTVQIAPLLAQTRRNLRTADLEAALDACRGKAEFDCVVNLSGGKDSCLLLYKLKREYKLNVLAFTTDINLPAIARKNIRRTVDLLDVPHMNYTPPRDFYRKMFRYLLQNQSEAGAVRTVCYICAPLFEGFSLRIAVEKKIPLVLAGYSPGQPEPDRMEYEFSKKLICETDWTPEVLRRSGLFTRDELELFWNPLRYPAGTQFPRYLAPFHAWPYCQEEAMKAVVKLGLVANRRNASPVHSNCPVNWLLMYSDLKHLGYNPYAPEFSKLIREGKANRSYWRVVAPVVNWMIRHRVFLGRNVDRSLNWLGLTPNDLRIRYVDSPPPESDSTLQPQETPTEAVGCI